MTISGRGTVATGRVERGELKLNEPVEIVGIKDTQNTVVTGIEMFRKSMDFCEAGDNVGCCSAASSARTSSAARFSASPVRLPRTPSSPARSTF